MIFYEIFFSCIFFSLQFCKIIFSKLFRSFPFTSCQKNMKPFCILLFLLNAVCAGTITELNADMALEIARNTNPFHIPKLMLMNKIFYAALKPYNEIFQCIWKECEISSYDQFDDNSILWISPSAYFKPESSCKKSINALIYIFN